jgi:hypothetical protein
VASSSPPRDLSGPQPGESPKARADRELGELLEEVRVALPGTELLLGFLFILPFNASFAHVSGLERGVYVGCVVVTALAAALLMAPTATHRVNFRRVDKEHLVRMCNRQVLAGLVLMVVSIALAMYLVGSVVLGTPWAGILAGGIAGWYALWWFALPLAIRRRAS